MTSSELGALAKKNPVTVACIVLGIALAAAIYFRMGSIPAATATLDAKSAEARKYSANIANAAQLKEQLEAITAANKAIDARLINPSELGINQQFFYKIEGDTGVKLIELSQSMGRSGETAPKGKLVPVVFFVSVQGSFTQVMTFLRALENGAHFSRIASASCTGGRSGPVSLTLTIELLGRS